MRSIPFSPADLLIKTQPTNCGVGGGAQTQLQIAQCANWELGNWYREYAAKADTNVRSLADLDVFVRNERDQLIVAIAGLVAVAAGTGLLLVGAA